MDASDRAEIQSLVTRLESAWNQANAVAFSAEFTENADFVNVRGEYGSGRNAIGAAHAKLLKSVYAGSTVRYSLSRLRPLAAGVAIAHLEADLLVPTGPLAGKTSALPSLVLVRDGGVWRIAAFHNTLRTA